MIAAQRLIPLLVVAVAGCVSLGDTFHVTAFLREQITGDTPRACLAREYQVQTRFVLRDDREWLEASRFSSKGWNALQGDEVAGWSPSDFQLSEIQRAELDAAQGAATRALAQQAVRPCECAKVQASFDGLIAAKARAAGNLDAIQKNFTNAVTDCDKRRADTR